MDSNDVEIVDDNPLGGADSVTVNDLTGTDVVQTNLDLAAVLAGNAPDGVVDSVVVNGTNGDDSIAVSGNGSGADVTGLARRCRSSTRTRPTPSPSTPSRARKRGRERCGRTDPAAGRRRRRLDPDPPGTRGLPREIRKSTTRGRKINTYVIRRRNVSRSPEELKEVAVRSKQVADDDFPADIRWIRSYVIAETDGTVGTSASTRPRTTRPSAGTSIASACRPMRSSTSPIWS